MSQIKNFKPRSKMSGQALVEFALTSLIMVLILTMIIEVARILQAYVTLQHAAREAARYAVTGQWSTTYFNGADSPQLYASWNSGTVDPLQHIAPCWPIFHDDEYAPDYVEDTRLEWQPYRGPRTCSIEEVAIRSMAGLNMNALGRLETRDPYAYQILVSGFSIDRYPTEGVFRRKTTAGPWADLAFDDNEYFNPAVAAYQGDNPGLSPGYGGDPGQRVSVQIAYELPMLTPLISAIVPTIRMNGAAVMTNEQFGGTGVQSSAVQPPALPDIPPLEDPVPADLVIPVGGITKTSPAGSPSPGQPVTFSVTVENKGDLNAGGTATLILYACLTPLPSLQTDNVNCGSPIGSIVVDEIDAGLSTTVSVPATFAAGGNFYVYGYIDTGLEIDEAGEVGTTVYDPDRELNNVRDLGTTIAVTTLADLDVAKTVDNLTPDTGEQVTYTITITNNGPNPAIGVQITDTLPTNVTYVSSVASQGSFVGNTWTVGDLGYPGGIAILNIVVTVNAASGVTVTNTTGNVTMSASITDPAPANNSDSVDFTVGAVDLRMTKAASSTNPGIGQTVTYTLTVDNLATTIDATNVQVIDTLPSQVTYVSATPSQGTCTFASGTVTCNLGTIVGGANATVAIAATVNTGTGGQTFTNTATVSNSKIDVNPANNTGSAPVTIASVDISVVKTSSVTNVPEGVNFTYTITARNVGLNTATGLVVRDLLPVTLLRNGHTASPGTYTPATGNWNIGTLAAGAQATLTIVVQSVGGTANTTINNTASLLSVNETDVNSANNSSTVGVQISNAINADLALTKSVNPTSVNPGANVTYTIRLTNNGPQGLTTIRVTDATIATALGNGRLQLVSASPSMGAFTASTGLWEINPTNTPTGFPNGSIATLTITVRVMTAITPFNNTVSITSANLTDPVITNNTANVSLTINVPAPIFVNAGDPASCPTQPWGAGASNNLNITYNWEQSKTYVPGSWGIYGSSYVLHAPPPAAPSPSSATFRSPPPPPTAEADVSAAGQNLLGCHVTGNDFYYQFDSLLPGNYGIYLVFADPNYDPGGRRFNVDAATQGTAIRLLRNYDIARTITLAQNTHPARHGSAPRLVHYRVEFFTFRVNNSGWLSLHFTRGRPGSGYLTREVMLNALGIYYYGP